MLAERFGEKVSNLVASVTEFHKDLSWSERKEEALKHIESFSHDSLLLKSADVIANNSELLEDFKKSGKTVFDHFNSPEPKMQNSLKHNLLVIGTIISQWPENPLSDDLKDIARRLERIATFDDMTEHPAILIEYSEYDENKRLKCPICHWDGTPKESDWIEYYDDLFDVSCPVCEKMLLVVSYPLIK